MQDYDNTEDILNDDLGQQLDVGNDTTNLYEDQQNTPVEDTGNNTEGQPSQPQQPQEPEFDVQQWGLKYKGQDVYPTDRNHLVNLAQKGWGYERAMEQINQERRQMQEMQTQLQTYKQLDEAMKQNPDFANYLWQQANAYTQNQTGQETLDDEQPLDPRVNELQQKLSEVEQWRRQIQEKEADQQLESEINKLRQKYADQPWDVDDGNGTLMQRLLQHAYENNLSSLETAYRDYMFDHVAVNSKAKTLKQEKERRQSDHRNGVVNTTSGIPAPSNANGNGYSRGDDYDDLVNKALNEF